MKWLEAFEGVQAATEEKDAVSAQNFLSEVELRIAVTPADGLRGLVIKLGLHQFFNEHANAASMQVDFGLCRPRAPDRHDPATPW